MRRTVARALSALVATFTVALTTVSCVVLPVPVPIPVPAPDWQVSPEPEPAPSPSGTGLERFTEQEVNWQSCGNGFDCGFVAAPLDWGDLDGDTISLYLVKQPATGTKLGTLFVNPGGPGASGGAFIFDSIDYSVGEELQRNFDVIGWDPRGVGASSAVHCFDDAEMDEFLFGDPREFAHLEPGSDAWIAQVRSDVADYGEACLEGTGELLGHVDTMSTVRDLDLMRAVVGDEQLNYLGFSYGTFIGALYADEFADRVGRMVLDGALAPDTTMHDVVLMQQQGFEASMRAYLTDCLGRAGCPFDGGVESSMLEIGEMLAGVDARPMQGADGRWVSVDTFLTAIILPLYSPVNWPLLDDLFFEIREAQTGTAQFLADFYYGRSFGVYEDNSTVAFSAINCLDYPRSDDVDLMREQAAEIAAAAPVFGVYSGYGSLSCLDWPFPSAETRGPVTGTGAAPILVVGTTGDPATPYAWSVELANQLESGVLVTYNGEGHLAYTSGNACIDAAVEGYFVSGSVPATDPNC